MIKLPTRLRGKAAAKLLAQSGAIQTGDILLSFRPDWSKTFAYGNIQMGISHAALAIVDNRGEAIVQTLESPISYSSNLDYSGHYDDLNYMHIVRPTLSTQQKRNLKKMGSKNFNDRSKATFWFL